MDGSQEKRARKLVEMLKSAGEHHGLLVVQGNVVIRDGVECADSPAMFEETDLQNAIALDLLEERKVSGSVNWEWYVARNLRTFYCEKCGEDVPVKVKPGDVSTTQLPHVLVDDRGHVVAEGDTKDGPWKTPT
jgi:hypothetical protein